MAMLLPEDLKKYNPDCYEILTKVKVRVAFIDKDVVLRRTGLNLSELNQQKNFLTGKV